MSHSVLTTVPHKSIEHVRQMMSRNNIQSVPVVNTDNEPIGIVTTSDLMEGNLKEGTPISKVMTESVRTIQKYAGIQDAAHLMIKHKIHHLVVTHEKEVVGVISSFDLLKLVEGKRFVGKEQASKK